MDLKRGSTACCDHLKRWRRIPTLRHAGPASRGRRRPVVTGPRPQVNDVAIKELLSLEVPPMELNEKNKLIARPVTKHRIMDLCLSCSGPRTERLLISNSSTIVTIISNSSNNSNNSTNNNDLRGFASNSSSSARPPSRPSHGFWGILCYSPQNRMHNGCGGGGGKFSIAAEGYYGCICTYSSTLLSGFYEFRRHLRRTWRS